MGLFDFAYLLAGLASDGVALLAVSMITLSASVGLWGH